MYSGQVQRREIALEIVSAGSEASGTDTVEAGVVTPLDDLRTKLQALMDDAPWLGSPQRSALLDAVAEVRADALDGVAADAFAAAAGIAAELIRTTFGVAA